MDKKSLVTLKGDKSIEVDGQRYDVNRFYRHLETGETQYAHMVYGMKMSKEFFDEHFEYAYDRIMRDWSQMSLLNDGQPITKTAFKKLADVHTYTGRDGYGKRVKNFIILFRVGGLEKRMYGFYPTFSETKAKTLDSVYKYYLATVNGDMTYIDGENIQFGNRGIPMVYGDLGVWKTDYVNVSDVKC